MDGMIHVFDMEPGSEAAALHAKYTSAIKAIGELDITSKFRDIFLSVVNEAYDAALSETQEAMEAVQSPRRLERPDAAAAARGG